MESTWMRKPMAFAALGIVALGAAAGVAIYLATRSSAPGAGIVDRAPDRLAAPSAIAPWLPPPAAPAPAGPADADRPELHGSPVVPLPADPQTATDRLIEVRREHFASMMDWLNRRRAGAQPASAVPPPSGRPAAAARPPGARPGAPVSRRSSLSAPGPEPGDGDPDAPRPSGGRPSR
jgi:hypothetical protein